MTRLLLAAYFLEAGLLLVVSPWTLWWDRNYFAGFLPGLDVLTDSFAVRVAVAGVGAMTAVAGIAELAGAIRHWLARRRSDPTSLRS